MCYCEDAGCLRGGGATVKGTHTGLTDLLPAERCERTTASKQVICCDTESAPALVRVP